MTPSELRSLLDRVRTLGATVTTNGRELRIRCWSGRLPIALEGELQLRQRELFAYLMSPVPANVSRERTLAAASKPLAPHASDTRDERVTVSEGASVGLRRGSP